MKICLDSLTLTDTEPVELIHSAHGAGFDLVSLWVQPPPIFPSQLVTPAKAQACAAALAETGLEVGPLEVFNLICADAVRSYRPALELGARLGAKSASAINTHNPNPTQVSELLAQFTELATEYGLGVTLEPLNSFATETLAQARDIIRAARVDVGIVFDVHHLVRCGGTVDDVRALEPGLIRYIQLCDGAASLSSEALRVEASAERMYPGEGVFPLVELLRNAPTEIPWGIEAPSRSRALKGMSAATQAQEAMAAVRRTLDKIAAAGNSASR